MNQALIAWSYRHLWDEFLADPVSQSEIKYLNSLENHGYHKPVRNRQSLKEFKLPYRNNKTSLKVWSKLDNNGWVASCNESTVTNTCLYHEASDI